MRCCSLVKAFEFPRSGNNNSQLLRLGLSAVNEPVVPHRVLAVCSNLVLGAAVEVDGWNAPHNNDLLPTALVGPSRERERPKSGSVRRPLASLHWRGSTWVFDSRAGAQEISLILPRPAIQRHDTIHATCRFGFDPDRRVLCLESIPAGQRRSNPSISRPSYRRVEGLTGIYRSGCSPIISLSSLCVIHPIIWSFVTGFLRPRRL